MMAGAVSSVVAQYNTDGMVLIDGIYYTLVTNGATGGPSATPQRPYGSDYSIPQFQYSGELTLPSSVEYEGTNYLVTFTYHNTIEIPFEKSTITNFTIGEGFTYDNKISQFRLSYDSSLERINIKSFWTDDTVFELPQNTATIGNSAFAGCTSLENITLPRVLTSLGSEAFVDCTSLAEIDIPPFVEEIKSGVFTGCTSLAKAAESSRNSEKSMHSGKGLAKKLNFFSYL